MDKAKQNLEFELLHNEAVSSNDHLMFVCGE